jgi:hypothetical protein
VTGKETERIDALLDETTRLRRDRDRNVRRTRQLVAAMHAVLPILEDAKVRSAAAAAAAEHLRAALLALPEDTE